MGERGRGQQEDGSQAERPRGRHEGREMGPQAALAAHRLQFEKTVAQGAFTYRERKTS